MDRGAWQKLQSVGSQSQTRLSNFRFHVLQKIKMRVQKISMDSPKFQSSIHIRYLMELKGIEEVNIIKVFYFRCLITVYIYLNFSHLEPTKTMQFLDKILMDFRCTKLE